MDLTRLVADAILSTAADALVATDRDGIIRVWNPSAVRIFGHHADEALGQSLDLIIPERLRARHWEGFRHVMATGASHYGEGDLLSVPGIRKDGQRISLEFTIVPLQDAQGHMQGIAAVMRDVTSRFEEIRSLQRSWRRQPQHPALGERPSRIHSTLAGPIRRHLGLSIFWMGDASG